MEKVNHEFLAELAKSNSPVLNSKPLQDGEPYYYKDNIEGVPLFREDMITIHELEVINNTLEEE